ncbi:hypothetical protein FQN57_006822 [Myotisia sp. PD_48]|nr:hypothetical protein FQN57_006822 [Myotisia sp. PD_48]
MVDESILRIPRSDSSGDFILIKASRSGTSKLDLDLVGTEGESPYVGTVKTSQINKLRAKNYRGGDDEWAAILSHVFKLDITAEVSQEWIAGLEVVAFVESDGDDDEEKELTITLRKRIDSITQRLGSVTLKQNDEQAIELFEWNGIAISRAELYENELETLRAKYRDAETTIKQLNSQLEDLIEAKNKHDDQLIGKFVELLNAKKLKIRDQQHLLASAKVDPAEVAELEEEDVEEKRPRKPAASRSSKRKAQEPVQESDSDDAFDTMDVDQKRPEPVVDEESSETEAERQNTPDPLEEETASEAEEEDTTSKPAPPKPQPAAETKRTTRAQAAPPKPPASPPPRRELPFVRKQAAKAAPPVVNKEDDTTSDDEL